MAKLAALVAEKHMCLVLRTVHVRRPQLGPQSEVQTLNVTRQGYSG